MAHQYPGVLVGPPGGYCLAPAKWGKGGACPASASKTPCLTILMLGVARHAQHEDDAQAQAYWALTAAISFARPCLASAKYMPVLGLV
jgi:hypothetical protein